MSQLEQDPHPDQALPPRTGSPGAGRRRLLQSGLATPAIIITLASRPVLGATCLTPSMAGSGNHSQHQPVSCTAARSTQYWIDNKNSFPGGYKQSTDFHPLFAPGPYLNFNYFNAGGVAKIRSLLEVLQGAGGTDPAGIGKVFVAALLSAANGDYAGVLSPVGPGPSVRSIESEYAQSGYFSPMAGKQWYAPEIIAYLQDPGSMF